MILILFVVVFTADDDLLGAVQLLGQDEPDQLVGEDQGGEGDDRVGAIP